MTLRASLSATRALTIAAEIDPPRRCELIRRLVAIQADLRGNRWFRPEALPDTHFMRFVLVEDDELPALLVWEANHDGDARAYLEAVARATPQIGHVFELCRGYPPGGAADVEAWVAWMRDRALPAAAFYAAYRGVPRKQVVNDRAVHAALREALDDPATRADLDDLHPTEIQRRLREHVRARHPALDTSAQGDGEARWWIGKLLAALGTLAVAPVLLVLAPAWLWVLRGKERRDRAIDDTRPVHDDRRHARREDNVRQNQLTHLVAIKPGWFRYATLRFVLFAIDVIARVHAVRGHLGGITSIHFARWVILRDPRPRGARHRLLFFSNYDGSWESYLGEFVDRAANGLTGVWSNTDRFPATRWLIRDGARDEEPFKQWARAHQITTHVWWSGVRYQTVQNVLDDVWIRRRLDRGLGDDEARAWLRKL